MAWLADPQWLWRNLAMAVFMLLLVPLCVLSLSTTPSTAQKLRFLVLQTSVEKEQARPPSQRDAYFLINHSLQMLCKYADEDYCARRSDTDLTVYPSERNNPQNKTLIGQNTVIIEKTKCNLTVEIQNVTVAFEGEYRCADRLNPGQFRPRRFYVGEAPEVPQNVSLVYEPSDKMVVMLDPVKTALDLNDPTTQWTVTFTWRNRSAIRHCSKEDSDTNCKHLTAAGLCRACVIPLSYDGCGTFSIGTLELKVKFNTHVNNSFGSVIKESWATYITDWVKPGQVSQKEVKDEKTTSSSLALTVSSPHGIDQAHYEYMLFDSFPLVVQYAVRLLSVREQSLRSSAGQRFFRTYGFVRNLHDDQQALQKSLQQSSFSELSKMVEWVSDGALCGPLDAVSFNISGLPFAGYHYNVSLTAKSRQWGAPVLLPPDQAKTKDAAPLEGPGLDDNFAYCLPPDLNHCVTCIIYFKEIPQTRRQGEITNHTLNVNLTDPLTDPRSEGCRNRSGVSMSTGGYNNTFLVTGLAVGGVYEVRVQAFNKAGSSPSIDKVLNVTSASRDFTPRDIVVERSGVSYDVYWRPGEWGDGMPLTYSAHYCYTVPLQLHQSPTTSSNGSEEAPLPLNCVTNMVKKTTSGKPEEKENALIFDQVLPSGGLTPAFFMSATTPQGHSSGLQPVDCFYARGKYPKGVKEGTVSAQPLQDDPYALRVTFTLSCGLDLSYRYGQPHFYTVAVLPYEGDCRSRCREVMRGQEANPQPMTGRLKDPEVYTQRHLQPQQRYCVGVNVAGFNRLFRDSTWSCSEASTRKPEEPGFPVWKIAIAVTLPLLFFITLFCLCYWCFGCKKAKYKFKHNMDFTPKDGWPSLKNDKKTEGMDNPMFTAESSADIQIIVDAECQPSSANPAEINTGGWRREEEEEDSPSDQTCSNNDDDDDEGSDGEDCEESNEEDAATATDCGEAVPPAPVGRYAAMPLPPAHLSSAGSEHAGEDDQEDEGSATESGDGDQEAEDFGETGEERQNGEGIPSAVSRMPAPDVLQGAGTVSPVTGPSRHDPDTALDLSRIFTNKALPELSLTPQTIDISGTQPAVVQVHPVSQPTAVSSPSLSGMSHTASLHNPPVSQSLQRSEASCLPLSSPPEVLLHPPTVSARPAQTVSPFREDGRTQPLPIDGSVLLDGCSLLSHVDIESVLNSSQKCGAGAFELFPSMTVGQDLGERPAVSDQSSVSDSHTPHQHEKIELQAVKKGGVSSMPPAPNPTQSPSIHPLSEGDGVKKFHEPESGGNSVTYTPLNLDTIRRAVEKSPWGRDFELSPCPARASLQQQHSMSEGSNQESGFSTDRDLASSTESGLEKLALTYPKLPNSPDHHRPEDHLVPAGSPPPQSDLGLLLTLSPAEGSLSDSSPDAHEDEGCGSPSQFPLLRFEYKPAVDGRSGDNSQHTSVRL